MAVDRKLGGKRLRPRGEETVTPRYLAYCRAHGRSPEDMLAYDKARYPGGHMTGFILWLGDRWRVFCRMHGTWDTAELERKLGLVEAHRDFDTWLETEGLNVQGQGQGPPGPEKD